MDAHWFVDRSMSRGERVSLAAGEAVAYSAPCPGSEDPNQDGALLLSLPGRRGVLAVADGLGGQPAGDKASRLALEAIAASVLAADGEAPLRAAILDGFERANHDVQALGVGAATTLVVAELQDDTLRTYHVGDSMILVVGQRGKRKLQTVSHSPVGYAVEAGLLDEGDALHHDELHLISNMVGATDMRIEIGSPLPLAARDTVLLASDGLLDNLHVEEIVETIRMGPLEAACESLVDTARVRMEGHHEDEPSKPDDLTLVAFRRG